MPTTFVYNADNAPVMRGEGLRPVLRYVRRSPVVRVAMDNCLPSYPLKGQFPYRAVITFADGSWTVTRWADWRVLLAWLFDRRWRGYVVGWDVRLEGQDAVMVRRDLQRLIDKRGAIYRSV